MRRRTKKDEALRYALALIRTAERYCDGYMVRSTFDRHMRHLWDIVEARGLRASVINIVDPLTR